MHVYNIIYTYSHYLETPPLKNPGSAPVLAMSSTIIFKCFRTLLKLLVYFLCSYSYYYKAIAYNTVIKLHRGGKYSTLTNLY